MKNQQLLINVHQCISKAELQQGFQLLLLLLVNDPNLAQLEQQVRSLESRYNRMNQKETMGFLTQDEADAEINQITYALLSVLDDLEKGTTSGKIETSVAKQKRVKHRLSKRSNLLWLMALVVLMASVGVFYLYEENKPQAFDLVIVFYGDDIKGNFLQKGKVRFLYGDDSKTKTPNKDGTIKLYNLKPELRGTTLKINPDFEKYSKAQIEVMIPENENTLEIVLKESSK